MTEIISRLFVGTREDAEALGTPVPDDWICIAVTEYREKYGRREELPREPQGSIDLPFMLTGKADALMLDKIAKTIWQGLLQNKKVLVHCVHAHERSPLAIVWFLMWSGIAQDIDDAYAQVIAAHPSTERRERWLVQYPLRRSRLVLEALDEITRLRT